MGRKEGRGGRRDEKWKHEEVVKKRKMKKVAKGRIIGLAGPCFPIPFSLKATNLPSSTKFLFAAS